MFEFRTIDFTNNMRSYLAELNGNYKCYTETLDKCDDKTFQEREYYSGRIDGLLSAIDTLTDGEIIPRFNDYTNEYEIMVKMKFDKD